MNWFFALAPAAACVLAGQGGAMRLQKRVKLLECWDAALARLESAAVDAGLGSADALGRCVQKDTPQLSQLLALMEAQPASSPESWLSSLSWEEPLSSREKEILAGFFLSFLSPFPEAQSRGMGYARQRWREALGDAQKAREANARLYRSLGWLSGAALFILFL